MYLIFIILYKGWPESWKLFPANDPAKQAVEDHWFKQTGKATSYEELLNYNQEGDYDPIIRIVPLEEVT